MIAVFHIAFGLTILVLVYSHPATAAVPPTENTAKVMFDGCLLAPGPTLTVVRVEDGETLQEAVVRELYEELGIEVEPIRELWQCTIKSGTRLHWWLVELAAHSVFSPDPNEVESYAWLKIAQIRSLPDLLPSNSEFFVACEAGEFELPVVW